MRLPLTVGVYLPSHTFLLTWWTEPVPRFLRLLFFVLPWLQLLPEDICDIVGDDVRRIFLHIACDVRVVVQREACLAVSNNLRQGLGCDTRIRGVRCEGVAQVVQANIGQITLFEYCFKLTVCFARIER